MLCCAVLCCAVLCCAVLCCAALRCAVLAAYIDVAVQRPGSGLALILAGFDAFVAQILRSLRHAEMRVTSLRLPALPEPVEGQLQMPDCDWPERIPNIPAPQVTLHDTKVSRRDHCRSTLLLILLSHPRALANRSRERQQCIFCCMSNKGCSPAHLLLKTLLLWEQQ